MRNINNTSNYQTSQVDLISLDIKLYSLTGSEVLVHNQLLGMGNITHRIFLSQTYLAKKLSFCRATINRALKRLAELGLIQKIDRGWKEERTRIKKTCYYLVSYLFDIPEIRKRYQHKFKSLNYLKLIANFEQIISSGYKHCIDNVTGIKFSSYFIFKNKEIADTSIKFQLRRGLLRTERLKQSDSKTIIERDTVMTEFTLPRVLQEAAFLNLAAKMDLAVFNEIIISHALAKLAVAKDIARPYAYVKGICKSETIKRGLSVRNMGEVPMVEGEAELDISAFRQSRPTASLGKSADWQNKYKKEEPRAQPRVMVSAPQIQEITLTDTDKNKLHSKFKGLQVCLDTTTDIKLAVDYQREMNLMKSKYPYLFAEQSTERQPAKQIETLTLLANNIAKAIELYKPNQFLPLFTLVKGLFNVPYRLTGEADEELAKEYMNHLAKKFSLDIPFLDNKPTINTPEIKPESITPNEEDYDEVLD